MTTNASPATVITVWSGAGGVGRSSLSIALANAARDAGISAVVVDTSKHQCGAALYVRHYGFDVTVRDTVGDDYTTEDRLRIVDQLRSEVDLVIVDTTPDYLPPNLVELLAADGATMLGVADASTHGITSFLGRNKTLAETVPAERLGFVLNRVPRNLNINFAAIEAAVSTTTAFTGAVDAYHPPARTMLDALLRRPKTPSYNTAAGGITALAPTAQKALTWAGLTDARVVA